MIGQVFQWNPKINIKIEIITPRAIKKVDRDLPKSWPQCWQFWTLDDCKIGCWADGTNPIMDFDLWALGLSSPMKNKKKFFWLLWKKMPFFEILHVKDYGLILLVQKSYNIKKTTKRIRPWRIQSFKQQFISKVKRKRAGSCCCSLDVFFKTQNFLSF